MLNVFLKEIMIKNILRNKKLQSRFQFVKMK